MVWIIKLRKFLILFIILIIFLLVSTSVIGINLKERNHDPGVISGSIRENLVLWDFDDSNNYLTSNTIIKDGFVQLQKKSSYEVHSAKSIYESGITQNLTINDDGELELEAKREELAIYINTNRNKKFDVNEEEYGYQTIIFNSSRTLSKIKFLARLKNKVSSDLNISIQTENDKILELRSLPPSDFSSKISEITVNFSCSINAATPYRLKFESEEEKGSYKLIGDSKSVYSGGYFQEIEEGTNEDDDGDIELEIYSWNYSSHGMLESNVNEFQSSVILKNLQCYGKNLSDRECVRIQVRTGNSLNLQNRSWSNWINVFGFNRANNNLLALPPASNIQYRIFLSSVEPNRSPTIGSINLTYQCYVKSGFVETSDFKTNETCEWLNFSAGGNYQDQSIEFYYSVDSGAQWNVVSFYNNPINQIDHSNTIRFLAKLNTLNTAKSPRLESISVAFRKFNPESTEIEDTCKEGEPVASVGTYEVVEPVVPVSTYELVGPIVPVETSEVVEPVETVETNESVETVEISKPFEAAETIKLIEFEKVNDLAKVGETGETPKTRKIDKDPEGEMSELKTTLKPQKLPIGIIIALCVFGGMFGISGWSAKTETGKFTLLSRLGFFIIPFYNKIDRDKLLDHYLRNQIYKYIQANPGTNYSEIMKDTGVKNGVLVHHLNMLDREGLIKSIRDGRLRRFYPIGINIPQKEIDNLSWFQIRIFNFIRMNPGITPTEIALEVGKSKQVVNYHLKLMKNAALVRAEELGKHTQLYVTYSESESKKIET